MHSPPVHEGRQRVGLARGIVYVLEQAILDRDRPLRGGLITVGCGEDVLDTVALPGGKQPGACRVIGGVQRHGEIHIEPAGGQGVYPCDDAHGGYGHLAISEPAHLVPGHALYRRADVLEVQHRLTHAHEDDGLKLAAEAPRLVPECQELRDDLAGRQVALKPSLGRGAEVAAHGAADLGGHTAGRPVGPVPRHEDGLDGPAVGEPEEELHRAILGDLADCDRRGPSPELVLQHGLQFRRKFPVIGALGRRSLVVGPQERTRMRRLEAIGGKPGLECRHGMFREVVHGRS